MNTGFHRKDAAIAAFFLEGVVFMGSGLFAAQSPGKTVRFRSDRQPDRRAQAAQR